LEVWGLLVADIITLVISAMIWSTWPSRALWVVGTLVGISMFFKCHHAPDGSLLLCRWQWTRSVRTRSDNRVAMAPTGSVLNSEMDSEALCAMQKARGCFETLEGDP
jgi:hypothetical protein